MTSALLRSDALRLPLADARVDLVVTSPPFLNLRSYRDAGEHYAGQIGTGTQAEFLEALWAATAEMARVLKPSGSIFVELGDSYSEKCLNLSPERYRISCVDRLGLIARAVICWSRPNGLPESVTDRVRRSHSEWVHLTKLPHYYSAVDEIRETSSDSNVSRARAIETWDGTPGDKGTKPYGARPNERKERGIPGVGTTFMGNPLGKLPGSVWSVATEPLRVPDWVDVDHFAAFPQEWPRRLILGWSPSGMCTVCSEGRRPVVEKTTLGFDNNPRKGMGGGDKDRWAAMKSANPDRITGEACACPSPDAPTRPAVVLDPFAGTGTTVMVARALGRYGVGVDLSADYLRLARWRVFGSGHAAKAVERTWRERQGGLFDADDAA